MARSKTAPPVPAVIPRIGLHPAMVTAFAEWTALLFDLRALDERLSTAVARIRADSNTDPGTRGLLIDESDVDGWLSEFGIGTGPRRLRAGSPPAAQGHRGGRLARLGHLFGLTPFERAVLLTTLAPEINLAYANLYAYVQDDVTRKFPTVDLVLQLWCSTLAERMEARALLTPDAPLRRHLLLTVDENSKQTGGSLLSRPLALDSRVAAYLLGSDRPDPSLGTALSVSHPMAIEAPGPTAALATDLMDRLARQAAAALGGRAPRRGLVGWLRGPESQGKRGLAEWLAATLGRRLLIVDCVQLVAGGGDITRTIFRALREARLQGSIVYWVGADFLAPKKEETLPELPADLPRLLADWPGVALFDIKTVGVPHLTSGPPVVELDFPAPSNERRRMLWETVLSGALLAADVDLDLLSGAFRLTGDQIAGAAETALQAASWHHAQADGCPPSVPMRDLVSAARAHSSQGLGAMARKIIPRYTWHDLVLPADRLAQLHEICNSVRFAPIVFEQWGFDRKLSSGKGVNVLFAGQPGTGKTMAAEVVASDLGLDLYKMDLSAMVSKYIGETEKNLEKIFREGRTSNAILFFDEADSIFGKRSEVKDSHDRYANMEISYLLQRMEEYDGIVILATNLRKNMDEAFVRRLRGAIEFPMPEEADRLEIWRRTFPPEAPLDPQADLAFLARQFKLSGGNIKNIVLEAAFLAAEASSMITMAHLVHATRREHQKIGRLIAPSDFGPYAELARKIDRAA